jgi:TPP-dependent 2-oxoacid decarboxylase
VLIVHNNGYTVERAVQGPEAAYNDIAEWDWAGLVDVFDTSGRSRGIRATTADELMAALAAADTTDGLLLIEVVVPALDVPPLLSTLTRTASNANARSATP